ncbi:MAG: hypothetical protein P4L83_08100 [Nevskia sp.]|nr:hypothetical protein [Nevskia sp.]
MNFQLCLRAAAAVVLSLPALAWSADAPPAGTVTMLTGRGTATSPDGTIRQLAKGDPVFAGEIISSSINTYVNLKFSDGGYFLLRPNSRFHIVDFVDHTGAAAAPAAPPAPAPGAPPASPVQPVAPLVTQQATQGGESHAFFRLLKGGFRSISGLVGKLNHDEYQVATPVATIGIRGTDYEAVICDAACASDPVVAAGLPAGQKAEGGLLTGVIEGRIAVGDPSQCPGNASPAGQQSGGCVEVPAGQYHLTTADGSQVVLGSQPHFLNVDPIPNPRLCQ